LEWRLANPDPNPGGGASDGFGGTMLSVGGDILIGAAGDDLDGDPARANAGSVYLVDGRTGVVLRKIPNPEPNSGDNFSYGALGTLGDSLLVGSPFDDPDGLSGAGTAYVIDKMTGAVLMRIPHPEPLLYGNSDDRFGRSVAGHEGNILVGAPADDQNGNMSGGAYLLDGKTGAILLRIANPDPDPVAGYFSAFGYPVRSFGGKIVIGEPWHRSGGKNLGAVHVFDGQTGALLYTIQHPKPMDQLDVTGNSAYFGWHIDGHGGFLAVGAPTNDVNGIRDAGSVYVYDLNTGQLVLTIHNPNPVAYDYFQFGAFHGGQIVGKAHGKEVNIDGVDVMNAGEVYVLEGPVR
jgi:outer membrane protein assembly factor BamB